MKRLAGLSSTTLINHSLTDCIPLKAQHANTISSTAGHLTSTSLTQLHANSITANAAPLTNTSVIGLEILRLCRIWWNHAVSLSLRPNHLLYCASVTFVALLQTPSFVSEAAGRTGRKLFWFSLVLPTIDWSVWLNVHASVKGAIQIWLWFHISRRQYTTRMIFN